MILRSLLSLSEHSNNFLRSESLPVIHNKGLLIQLRLGINSHSSSPLLDKCRNGC